MSKKRRPTAFEYDVTLSFAGEDRKYVERVAECLVELGVRVFYDKYEEVDLWGKDLYSHLSDLYRNSARYCIMFVSKHYATKLWPSHERKSAQERAFKENKEYILPARFDSTRVPGLLDTIGYISLTKKKPADVADMIATKVVEIPRQNYFPMSIDRLLGVVSKEMRLSSPISIARYEASAHRLFRMLTRLTEIERDLVFTIIFHGCVAELPNNVHVDLIMLRRVSSFTRQRVEKIASGIGALGFHIDISNMHHGIRKDSNPTVVLDWRDLSDAEPPHPTLLMHLMIKTAAADLCEECGLATLRRMDFSQLSSRTATEDEHL